MLTVPEAVRQLCEPAPLLVESETCPLEDAFERVLAGDVYAPIDVPPADNSAMDGFALRHADWPGAGSAIPVSARIPAGDRPGPLAEGTAARIFTGADIPAGADTVVMQEHCEVVDGGVRVLRLPKPGANVRARGQDISAGQHVLEAGRQLRAQDLGLLASLGLAEVPVFERLRVAIVSNGDELVEPGDEAGPGRIYNSNRYLLRALVEGWGFRPVDMGIARDDPEEIAGLLQRAAERADVILCSGGVSVGEEDHVKAVVESLGSIDFWKVAVKPGKPLAFGRVGDTPFLGLPGNPASVLVTCLVLARPWLFRLQGRQQVEPVPLTRPARFESPAPEREVYLRASNTREGVEVFPNQSSGVLLSAVWGDGLAVQRAGQAIRPGDPVDFLPYAVLR